MGSGGVAIAALPTVICLKVPFSDGLGGVKLRLLPLQVGCSKSIFFCMVLPPLMHGLKAQKRLAQGKRSDTLGQSMLVSDAL